MAVDPTITALDPWLHSPPRVVECLIQPGGTATVALRAGDELTVVDVHGQQVVDFWAYIPDWLERSSMEHTRVHSRSMRPTAGDTVLQQHPATDVHRDRRHLRCITTQFWPLVTHSATRCWVTRAITRTAPTTTVQP